MRRAISATVRSAGVEGGASGTARSVAGSVVRGYAAASPAIWVATAFREGEAVARPSKSRRDAASGTRGDAGASTVVRRAKDDVVGSRGGAGGWRGRTGLWSGEERSGGRARGEQSGGEGGRSGRRGNREDRDRGWPGGSHVGR